MNIRHRPGSVGVYKMWAERYLLPFLSTYSDRLEHGAVNSRSAETSLFPTLYPPCSTTNPSSCIVPSFTSNLVIGEKATLAAES